MNIPQDFLGQSLIDYFNLQPSAVKGRFNTATELNKRYLYTQLFSSFIFSLPNEWDMNFFRFWLFHYGSIAVIYTNEFGWIVQPYSITKLNLYYNPKEIIVYNQKIKSPKKGVIGVNSEIIRLMDDYFGLDDIVTKYAVELADIDKAINLNLMNCNVAKLFEAKGKKEAEALKEAYSEATTGKPLVVLNQDVMDGKPLTTLMGNVKNDYIVTELLMARRSLINSFLTLVGIKNANYEKKERMNSQEVNQNNDETGSIISVIYDTLSECFDRVNEITGMELTVKLRYDYTDGGMANVENDA